MCNLHFLFCILMLRVKVKTAFNKPIEMFYFFMNGAKCGAFVLRNQLTGRQQLL